MGSRATSAVYYQGGIPGMNSGLIGDIQQTRSSSLPDLCNMTCLLMYSGGSMLAAFIGTNEIEVPLGMG